jgi:hypothetical protein
MEPSVSAETVAAEEAGDEWRSANFLFLTRKRFNIVDQQREFVGNHIPDDRVRDDVLAVNDDVAKSDDLLELANLPGGFGRQPSEPLERLANYLELSLSGRFCPFVGVIVIERFAADE